MVAVPEGYNDLLERALFAHFATTRPDGTVQVNPMWFDWTGTHIRLSHSTKRQKYRNVLAHQDAALSIADPENPYRYLEVRGKVEEIQPDPAAEFYLHLNQRYGGPFVVAHDAPDRVIFVIKPTSFSKQ
jgi:PPOX class probable F420-dependent enzyme